MMAADLTSESEVESPKADHQEFGDYELLDEMMDNGYPQNTLTETLKNCVHNEPIVLKEQLKAANLIASLGSKTKPSGSSKLPIAVGSNRQGKQKNEIYVDIIEKLTVLFNSNGYVVNSAIDGTIQMTSYLSGNPELRLALNEDLVIGKRRIMAFNPLLDFLISSPESESPRC